MRSSGWLFPSVVAGSFRTTLAKEAMPAGRDFDLALQDELLTIEVAGVLPLAEGQLYLPAPNDCVLGEKGKFYRAKPGETQSGEGADWPAEHLQTVLIDAGEEFKPEKGPEFWPMSRYAKWLSGETFDPRSDEFLKAPLADLRAHVSLNSDTGSAEEGLLFTTAGVASRALQRFGLAPDEAKPTGKARSLAFREIELSARVENVPQWGQEKLTTLSTWHPLGGERRLAHWQTCDHGHAWECPEPVRIALARPNLVNVTMTLVTPAIFRDGWKPGWLENDLCGAPIPGGPRLRLVGVSIQRWRAVSGWSYKDRGPKAIRRVVTAGGVYFFELLERNSAPQLEKHWLRSVSDGEQERRDGFGLAVWGTW
jgi:CRISPR-associated protein Cmr3